MAKTLANYDPLVQIPSGMTPAGADFPIVESHDILVGENDKRLDAKLDDIDSAIGNVGATPIATQLSSKVNTSDIQTAVRDASSASDSKIPSEKAVRSAIDSKTINVDSTVTQGSTNAVSGGAVYTQLATKQDALTFDTTPTASSSNPVTSGGVKAALDTKQDALTFDSTPTASSSNPVTSGGVKAALDNKQNTLTYETTPIVGSVNPVTSTGIRNAIDAAAAGNLGKMQAQYDEFVTDAEDVLEQAKSLSNGMVACSNIDAETTVGDTRILLYTGTTNSTYTNGHWYYNSAPSNAAPSWTDGGAVGSAPTIDNTLTVEGAAANSKAVGDAIENIVTISNTQPGSNSGNKVWIKETTSEEVQIPTYEEHIAKANKADIATNNESDNGSGTITASKKYAIGDHFYINNTNTSSENFGVSTLYKATATIASGDAIAVGTNCEASKVADEITSLSNDIDTVKADLGEQDISFTPIEGKYITNNGNDSTSNNFARSNAIEVSAGTIIEFSATGYLVNVAMIAVTDANETTFTPVSISIDSDEHTYRYTAPEDCYVVVSYLKSKSYMLLFKAKWSNTALDDRVTAIETNNVPLMSDAIGMDVVADNISVTIGTTGKYVNNSGTLSTSSNLNISTPITLKKGQTIVFNAIGYLTSVALLAKVNESGAVRPYAPIIVSVDSEEHTNSYTASIDMSVVISSHKRITPKYTISTSAIQKLSADATNLKRGWVAFATIGVIGDSLASGASNYTGGVVDRPVYSWGKCIEREHGIVVTLFSAGGTTTRSWLTGSFGLAALNNSDPLDCYIIGLGVNDAYSLGAAYLGSISDIHIGNESENGDTYYGNYSRIIAAIKAKSPRAKIICLTNPRGTSSPETDFNDAVKDIVDIYDNTYLIDLTEDDFYTSLEFKLTWYGAHSTAVGYKLIAENLYNHLAELIQDNINDFLDIQWIAKDHA